ncbi:hypothetical protein BDV96DRAFT_580876 [Lophiotrema nucula]|uniref:Uncharacterized protein n=1 Tax=Lophiotrema nucula TaxID=690887 RepID=A0A6A5YZC1_9PLEO|nr:hypothetical protein BDV96DRAFT_580876 [Lophiotrema nucula]
MPRAYSPTPTDVRLTRAALALLGLPNELTLLILDFAHYWVEVTHECIDHYVVVNEWSLDSSGAHLYLSANLPQSDPRYPDEEIRIKEIAWTIVSHDQGWTTDHTEGTYQTSSWFEVSIVRHNTPGNPTEFDQYTHQDLYVVGEAVHWGDGWKIVPRPSENIEFQRLHSPALQRYEEGKYAWWLQGNKVAKGTSVFEDDMVKRYRVLWGCEGNVALDGNEGAGGGEDFIKSLQKGDIIVVWARAKRRGWENHVFGVRMTLRYSI